MEVATQGDRDDPSPHIDCYIKHRLLQSLRRQALLWILWVHLLGRSAPFGNYLHGAPAGRHAQEAHKESA